jgi:hypothetical protein
MSYAGKLSVMALGLSMALAMLIGSAAAKDAQPGAKKNRGARAKKARDGAKKNADGAKAKRRRGGQPAKLQAINAIVADLTAELNLTDAQKTRVEEIIKKHLKAPAKGKGKGRAPGDPKKPRGKKGAGKRGGKKKNQGATKGNPGPGVDRF